MSTAYNMPVDFAEERYRPIEWATFVRELLESYKPPLKAHATYRQMAHAMRQVTELVAIDDRGEPVRDDDGRPVPLVTMTSDLTPKMLARLLSTRRPELSPHSVRALLRCIRCACNIAVDAGYLRMSPFGRRNGVGKLVRAPRPTGRRHLTRAEIRALLDLLAAEAEAAKGWKAFKSKRLQALVATIAYTGIRRNEALFLRVSEVDIPGRMIHVRPHDDRPLKTARSEQMVPMPLALVPILESWMPWRLAAPPGMKLPAEVPWMFPSVRRKAPWHDGTAGDKPLSGIKAAGVRAGIGGDINFKMLRASLATHLRTRFGVGRDLTSRILRHSEQVDDEHYLCDDPDNLRDAVKDVDF